jgi:hypothetical protein
MKVSLDRKKPTTEEMANVAVHPEDSKRTTPKESVRTTEDRSRDHEPAVGSRKPLKRRTKNNVVQGTRKGWMFGKKVLRNRVLRGVFGPKRDEVTGG